MITYDYCYNFFFIWLIMDVKNLMNIFSVGFLLTLNVYIWFIYILLFQNKKNDFNIMS